jgi:hypothetical protein
MNKLEVNLTFIYSKKGEVARVLETIQLLPWYRAHKYRDDFAKLPQGISDASSAEDVEGAVAAEYIEQDFRDVEEYVRSQWGNFQNGFIGMRAIKDLRLSDSYEVNLTKYGSGGSYNAATNALIVNIRNSSQRERIAGAIVHEIIHMTIQHLIDTYAVSHWKKEALVDHLLAHFFPMLHMRQSIPEDVKIVDDSFNAMFPDLEKIAKTIGGAP